MTRRPGNKGWVEPRTNKGVDGIGPSLGGRKDDVFNPTTCPVCKIKCGEIKELRANGKTFATKRDISNMKWTIGLLVTIAIFGAGIAYKINEINFTQKHMLSLKVMSDHINKSDNSLSRIEKTMHLIGTRQAVVYNELKLPFQDGPKW